VTTQLFIADIDGCLGEACQPYGLDGVRALSELAAEAGAPDANDERPAVSLCSGRAYPYVEAVTQMLDLRAPVLFESGGGMFDLREAEVTWNPTFTDETERALNEVGRWLREEITPNSPLMFDYGKRTQRGVVGDDRESIAEAAPRVRAHAERRHDELCAYATSVSVDVLAEGITKRQALAWIADHLSLDLNEVAYIGDTEGDLGALASVGRSFAPANAEASVREAVDHVTDAPQIEGTLEAYRACLERNRKAPQAANAI
jgi:hydroxymethylpyrimidine pyrophosphatase-like HAD family hydrolase